jgi:KDO2-lipid IV(A) lauroyltransferase
MTLRAIEPPAAYERIRRALRPRRVAVFALSFWSLCGVLPLGWASALGGFVMGIGGLYVRRMRKVRANLEIALPDLSSSEQNRLARDMRYNLGRTWAELPHLAEICRPGSP